MTCIAFDFVSKRIATVDVSGTESAAHTDLLTDTLYLAVGATVLPLFEAASMTGVYRSAKFVTDSFPSFAWMRVEGPITSVVVRLYGDGVLRYTSPAVTTNSPVRAPPGRYREMEIEVVSTSRVTEVVLATTAAELAQT